MTVTVISGHTPDPDITGETQLSATQSNLLKHAVKDLLGFSQMPTPAPKQELKGKQNALTKPIDDEAPQYMMDLYEKYKYGKISKGRKTGNTVRSIKAQLGIVSGETVILFNLSSINPSESVFNGEIHVHRRKRKNDLHLMLTQVAPLKNVPLETVQMTGSKAGWQSFDVTVALKACLASKKAGIHLVAAKFVRKDGRRVNVKRIMKTPFRPFLIVFSNDTQNITLDHMEPYFNPRDLKQPMIDPETGNEIRTHRRKNRRRPPLTEHVKQESSTSAKAATNAQNSDNDATSPFTAATHVTTFKDAETSRNRRSIFDNEIPNGPMESVEPEVPYNHPPTHAGVTHSKAKEDAESSTSSRFLPYPENYKERSSRRRKNRRKNRRKEKTLPLPAEWEALARQQENKDNIIPAMHNRPALCGRRKLIVDFADIGWNDWIISPKSFEAHYCAGQCPFPLTKGLRPSNHATIQSLVHAIGIRANVPAPCCVPDVMSSVTLLYFDENRNVVLKNYPSMTVQSCACR